MEHRPSLQPFSVPNPSLKDSATETGAGSLHFIETAQVENSTPPRYASVLSSVPEQKTPRSVGRPHKKLIINIKSSKALNIGKDQEHKMAPNVSRIVDEWETVELTLKYSTEIGIDVNPGLATSIMMFLRDYQFDIGAVMMLP